LALLDGATLTAVRTGAAAGLATDRLARPEAATVALFGAGAQARTQLEAVCHVRAIRRGWVVARRPESAVRLVEELRGRGPIPADLRVAATPAEALAEADVVCTATTSRTPVFAGRDVRPGTHVNGVGSFTPEMQEVDAELVARALVVVDARESALAEAGDLVVPLREGRIAPEHIHAELGEIVTGRRPGRSDAQQITFFKSCGLAVQDAVAAGRALARARQLGLGREVEL
jgi:ornithine cyclodeaminase